MSPTSPVPSVQRFTTDQGAEVYQLSLEAFPDFWTYTYLVFVDDLRVLIDAGSGYGNSNDHLEMGFQTVSEMRGEQITFADLTHVLITHGHIDHFGGVPFLRTRSQARIGIHELDYRTLTGYEERLTVVSHRLRDFFIECGLSEEERQDLLELYTLNKHLFHSVAVDFTFEEIGMELGPLKMLHTPGHCAGHVVIRLHNLLFSGDHVLNRISPHMAPESLTKNTGLEHYLASLRAVQRWGGGVSLTLGGHEPPVFDLFTRVDEIISHHHQRLEDILACLDSPRTIGQLSQELFGKPAGYNAILAVEETGAHIEYLYQRGKIAIANLEELERCNGALPLKYVRKYVRRKEPSHV